MNTRKQQLNVLLVLFQILKRTLHVTPKFAEESKILVFYNPLCGKKRCSTV